MMSPPPADLLTALQGLVTQWRSLAKADAIGGVAQARKSTREYFGRVNAAFTYQACADELLALLAGVPEPPTNDDDVTRRDSLTPIAPPQPAPTITALMRDCPDCRFYGPVPCPGCGRPVEAVNARLLQPIEVQTVSFNDLPQHLELHESGVSQQSAQPRGIGARLADAGETIRLRSEVNRWRSVVRRVIDIANSQELDEGDIAELKALSEEVERGVPEGAAPGAPETDYAEARAFVNAHAPTLEELRRPDPVPLPGAAASSDLHQQIRNIQPMRSYLGVPGEEDMRHAYLLGHRDARHDAAELVAALPSPPDGWQPEKVTRFEVIDHRQVPNVGRVYSAHGRLQAERDELQDIIDAGDDSYLDVLAEERTALLRRTEAAEAARDEAQLAAAQWRDQLAAEKVARDEAQRQTAALRAALEQIAGCAHDGCEDIARKALERSRTVPAVATPSESAIADPSRKDFETHKLDELAAGTETP